MIFYHFTVLIVILNLEQFSSRVNCLTKTYFALNQWFENPRIWSAKRLPCERDTVVLPDNVALYLNKPISASKIILPKNGILILDQKNWISKVDNNSCSKGQENKLVIRKNDWFDTSNWNVKYLTFEFKGTDEFANPVPHINRIPCQQDEVRFKSKSTFKVSIDSANKIYKFRNIFVNNKKFESRLFKEYTSSKIGKLQFNVVGKLPFFSANDKESSDHDVQMCQNNFNYFYNKICQNVANKCPQVNCIHAIRPTGFCCDLCGSVVSIETEKVDNELLENNLINIHLNKYDQVNFFSSKISETKVQIIFIDSNQMSRQSRMFAQEMVNFLKTAMFYKSKTIEHQFSIYLDEQNGNLPSLMIIVTLILITSVLVFVYHHDLRQNIVPALNRLREQINRRAMTSSSDAPFTFIRFSSDHDMDLEMEANQRTNDELKLRTKNDSVGSNISSKSVLFTVDEQDENISFNNPFFKKDSPDSINIKHEISEEEEL